MAIVALSFVTSEPPPLNIDEQGVVRVGGTRVTLDTVIAAYKQHTSAEEIAEAFPVLDLADVHAVIAYYLRHSKAVEDYLEEGERKAADLKQKIESRYDPNEIRQRMAVACKE
jgi:uncharacterized protein (DUF433 family)